MNRPSKDVKAAIGVLIPLLLVNWIAFAQVVSFQGLAIWIICGSLLVAYLVVSLIDLGKRVLALLTGVGLTIAVPALAEGLGGNTAGPITRASLVVCGVTLAMAFMLRTQYAWVLPAPALAMFAAALGLGATGHVDWLVGAWAVAAALTLLMLGPYSKADLNDPVRLKSTATHLSFIGLIAVISVVVLVPILGTGWTIASNTPPVVPDVKALASPLAVPSSSTSAVLTPIPTNSQQPAPVVHATRGESVAPKPGPTRKRHQTPKPVIPPVHVPGTAPTHTTAVASPALPSASVVPTKAATGIASASASPSNPTAEPSRVAASATPVASAKLTKKQKRAQRRAARAAARAAAAAAAAAGNTGATTASASATPVAAGVTSTPTPSPTAESSNQPSSAGSLTATDVLLVVLVTGLYGLLFMWLIWLFAVAAAWELLRLRLARGEPNSRVVGAWTWVRLRRQRFDQPLPVHASPDVAVTLARGAGDTSLETVAALAATAAFDAHHIATKDEVSRAWASARIAGRRPSGASLRSRLRWAHRLPQR